jgi:hypothetical protein
MAARLAEMRRRDAMAQAWGATRGAANGFEAVALSLGPPLGPRPVATAGRRGLLDPAPAPARATATPRRTPATELAEARR